MSTTNSERIGKAMELLQKGLAPFIERELTAIYGEQARAQAARFLGDDSAANQPFSAWDAAALLKLMEKAWGDVFCRTLGSFDQMLVQELQSVYNKWTNEPSFSSDDTYRAIDSTGRLLAAVSAPEAQEVERGKMELLRVRFDEQARSEMRKSSSVFESQTTSKLKPWREVITPHRDVASGRYQQAEFAADLWQVHLGEGADEYRDPVEFFRRTFLTESLKRLLTDAVLRLSGAGADPVVQLQTNFGGGKTHSMLALYHLFSGTAPDKLAGIENVLQDAGISRIPRARRVVLVGNKISPGNPVKKPDGTVVRTLWGELAWQIGGKEAYERVRADDERATSPGDVLRTLFNDYGPCLVLIDEWVAYARQLHDQNELPGGSFETQFSFAQALTESAKLARNCMLVISLPASDTAGALHMRADDVEVGGQRGREALERLRNVVGRLDSSWRPASAEEGFEIVRRRLFEPFTENGQYKIRDAVVHTFHDFYSTQNKEFPPECASAEYEKRMISAYPIHPEVFDRLYTDWSTLVKFQRTRGVLRLMAAVIHSLWENGDRNPLILPCSLPIDDPRVRFELTRYLSDNWLPIIEKDVDGPNSLPVRMDNEYPNLGKMAAFRRVARTIYLGSAPTQAAANQGIEDRRVRLGCVMPGESISIFGDALRRLAATATYLYQDGTRYWYSLQPTVTKLAEDRAEQLQRDPDKVALEIGERLRANLRKTGDFSRIHPMPRSSQDVPDELEARLVVLDIEHPYRNELNNPAETAAKDILASRGSVPRLYANTLVFLAADNLRLEDLKQAVCQYLAWKSIIEDQTALNLLPHQVKQAEMQKKSANDIVDARLPETYQWLLVPVQGQPQDPIELQALRLTGGAEDALAVRVSQKLRNKDLLVPRFAASLLRKELDRVPLWRGNHVSIRQIIDDFARYVYLPRMQNPSVLVNAICSGISLLSWEQDSFAYADEYDETRARYRGLQTGCIVNGITADSTALIVKPDVARRQIETEKAAETASFMLPPKDDDATPRASKHLPMEVFAEAPVTPTPARPKRFYGTVTLDTTRAGRDASEIAEEVITHLAGLVGARVTVTLEIEATVPDGIPENVVRIVNENSRALKFSKQGFENE